MYGKLYSLGCVKWVDQLFLQTLPLHAPSLTPFTFTILYRKHWCKMLQNRTLSIPIVMISLCFLHLSTVSCGSCSYIILSCRVKKNCHSFKFFSASKGWNNYLICSILPMIYFWTLHDLIVSAQWQLRLYKETIVSF